MEEFERSEAAKKLKEDINARKVEMEKRYFDKYMEETDPEKNSEALVRENVCKILAEVSVSCYEIAVALGKISHITVDLMRRTQPTQSPPSSEQEASPSSEP